VFSENCHHNGGGFFEKKTEWWWFSELGSSIVMVFCNLPTSILCRPEEGMTRASNVFKSDFVIWKTDKISSYLYYHTYDTTPHYD
jgi:hypothetical protein